MKKHFKSKHWKNRKVRLYAVMLSGLLLFFVSLYWKDRLIKSQEYVGFPIRTYNTEAGEMRSKNYQLDTQEISPSIR